MTHAALVRALAEVIAALDRRVPHPERPLEHTIAHDSATLRAEALTHLARLGVEHSEAVARLDVSAETTLTGACPDCGSTNPVLSLLTSMTTYFACRRCGRRWQIASN